MSLDVYLNADYQVKESCICSCCDNEHERKYTPELFHANITHNLGEMAKACGLYECLWRPDENGYVTAGQIIDLLQNGLTELLRHPDKYVKYNPENRWGSYDGFIRFVSNYLNACREYPDAFIEVSR